jgi:hypothetical protein
LERPFCCQLLPEITPPDRRKGFNPARDLVICTPICPTCEALPRAERLSRNLKILKGDSPARYGKSVAFVMASNVGPYPR